MRSPNQTLIHVGNKIRERRKMFGMSQWDLADRAGYKADIISRIERGKNCRLNTLLDILQVLELELEFK